MHIHWLERQTTTQKVNICDRIWEKGALHAKRNFFAIFKLSPFQGLKSPRLLAWFISSLGLLLHRSNIKSYIKPPVPSSGPPKRGIKWWFSNTIDVHTRPAHAGSGRGSDFLASVAGWWKNIHAKVQVHSWYGSWDIVLKWKFRNSAKCPLFSDPVTYTSTTTSKQAKFRFHFQWLNKIWNYTLHFLFTCRTQITHVEIDYSCYGFHLCKYSGTSKIIITTSVPWFCNHWTPRLNVIQVISHALYIIDTV